MQLGHFIKKILIGLIMNDLTILIQGPYNKGHIDKIFDYKKFTDSIVYSTWHNDDLSQIPEFVKVVSHTLPDQGSCYCCNKRMKNLITDSTIAWAVGSVHAGLKVIDSEFTIKIRSDEYYVNLQPMIDLMHYNRDKIVCGNIFVNDRIPFHMGDHIFGGNTKVMQKCYDNILSDHHNNNPFNKFYYNYFGNNNYPSWPAESMLACNLMKAMGKKPTIDNFMQCFEIVDINLMKPFKASHQHAQRFWTDTFTDHNGIFCMEDLKTRFL